MKQYKDLVNDVLNNGTPSDDRTGTGTLSVFGRQMRFNLQDGFPLVTLKKTYWKGVLVELLWLLQGETNVKFLQDHGVKIWDEWADEDGELGPVYGQQWRAWEGRLEMRYLNVLRQYDMAPRKIDQIANVINQIKNNPNSRRIIVNAWNVDKIEDMNLPPCHCFFQFYVRDGKLSCQLYQRSADLFLGVPFNIASYALLTHLIAHDTGLQVGDFIHTLGDVHLYNNHLTQAHEMVSREPKGLSQIETNLPPGQLLDFIDNRVKNATWDEIKQIISLKNYNPHPTIKAEVSV